MIHLENGGPISSESKPPADHDLVRLVPERPTELPLLRAILDGAAGVSIIAVNTEGLITVFNSGAEHMLGYTSEEIVGKHTPAIFHLESEVIVRGLELTAETGKQVQGFDVFTERVRNDQPEEREWTYVRKDGSHLTVNLVVTILLDASGATIGFLDVAMDITARRNAEDSLRASEERARLMINAVKDYALLTLDADGHVISWNAGAERMKGYTADEIVGRHFSCFYPPEVIQQGHPDQELRIAAEEGRYTEEGWRVRKDGSRFWADVIIAAVYYDDGKLCGFAKVTRDITERKRAEKRLHDQALLLDLANDGIFIRDSEDRITYWNQGAQRLYGWSAEETSGKVTHSILKTQFPQPLEDIQAHLVLADHWEGELVHSRRDGSLVTVASTWTLLRDSATQLASVLELSQDITEKKRVENALHEAQHLLQLRLTELDKTNQELDRKNVEVEAFVYIVSHDLRAPLVNLQGFCKELELCCKELQEKLSGDHLRSLSDRRVHTILTEDIPDSLRFITTSTTKFHRLINSLLELSRYGRQEYHLEELDLDALVQSTLDLVRLSISASGVRVSVAPLPTVYGDATALGQVFSNLIGNSIKYLLPGRAGHIEIGGGFENGEAHCWVGDNGSGLPASAYPRLFQVFQRFHPALASGEGMGLAIVKRVIERHGGRIWAESEEGVGTTFHFTLPSGRTRE